MFRHAPAPQSQRRFVSRVHRQIRELMRIGREVEQRLHKRVLDELTTTFASNYTRVIGLAEALQPEVLRAYERKATGEKFLIDPTRG